MSTRNPRLLTLSLAIIATVAACKKTGDAPTAAAPAEPQAKPLTLDEGKLPKASVFSATDLDPGKAACGDFNEYVNGKWMAANPIPGDRSSWGVSEILGERSLAIQRQLAEQAAADKNATGVEKIIGDFWATGMDEAKIEAQGIAPIQPQLAAIDGLNDTAAIAGYIRKQAAIGDNPIFDFDAEADFKQSSMNIAYASQGGLGLPDKTYYSDADKRDVLDAYRAHIAKVLELTGTAAADAAEQAKTVIAFETRLAKASLSEEDLRDVSLYYNPVSLAQADKQTPNFSWSEFFKSQDVAAPQMFSLPMPAFHQEVSKMLGDTDPAAWRSYLRFHAVDGAAPYLSDKFVQENFNFYSRTLYGQKEIKQRWKRVLGTLNGEAGEAMGQLYVKVAFPADSKARMETLVGNLRTALKGRIENLPWMSDETKKKAIAKWETFTPKIGYPDKWRDWSGLA
ncbi:MAG: peptidase, partial [Pseudoxanthomonas sp.]